MPSPKDIRHFSEKWLELFDWFEEHPDDTHVVETDSPARANTLRFEFYRARDAMRREAELAEHYVNTNRREVTIDGSKVIFRFKDKTPLAELLARSLRDPNDDHP